MKGYFGQIEHDTLANENFRQVLFTGPNMQLVVMTLQPGEEIGLETHGEHDQFFRFEDGTGKVIIDEDEYEVKDGDGVIVPAGAKHNVINISEDSALRFYTIYAPPEHPDGTVHATREQAMAAEHE